MTPPFAIPYVVIAGVLLVSLAAPLFIGWHLWFVPVIVLPFALLYLLYDRRLAQREHDGGGAH